MLDGVLGREAGKLSRERAAWAISALLPGLMDREELAPITRYLVEDPRGEKRRELCERIAYVFDQYAVYRPDWVRRWEAGEGTDWQALLWRALIERLGPVHIAARMSRFVQTWDQLSELPAGLPRRISIIGISSLPPIYLEILARFSQRAEVHLLSLSPSPEFWGDVQSARELAREGELQLEPDNLLLGSLGKVGRDFQQVLESTVDYAQEEDAESVDPGTGTALSALQSDIFALRNRGVSGCPPLPLLRSDRSIALHSCHSPMREVEVLRDRLLGLLHSDSTLEPRNIVVMVPDVDAYAPYIEAVFGTEPSEPGFLPHRIADRSERAQSPVSEALLLLLRLCGGRFAASEVLDLLELEPVRARFGITPEEQAELARRVHDVGIRWGVDAAHRASFGQPELDDNTWRFGLTRLLVGYALPLQERATFAGVLPYDDVEGDQALGAGRLARFAETLFARAELLKASRPLSAWRDALFDALAELVAEDDRHSYALRVVREKLNELVAEAESVGFVEPVSREVILAVLSERLESERSSHDFLAGGVTFCALLPMRSIPFRVVCLLGLDDEAFPRVERTPSFDRVKNEPRMGDRTLRDDDRYLFLEALLSARDHLHLSWVGRAIQDNSSRPPSVVVGELLEVLDRSFVVTAPESSPQLDLFRPPAQKPSKALVIEHPLAPFSERYFDGSDPRLFSYAVAEAEAARVRLTERRRRPALFPTLLGAAGGAEDRISVDELARFFELPVRHLLERRLRAHLRRDVLSVQDREPMELSWLEQHAVGSFMVERLLQGLPPEGVFELTRAAGLLPLGALGRHWFETLLPETRRLLEEIHRHRAGKAVAPLRVELPLSGGALFGAVGDLYAGGQVRHGYSKIKPKRALSLWVRHLALCASGWLAPSVLVGRKAKGGAVGALRLQPLSSDEAREHLEQLVALYRLGERGPLPLFPAASWSYAKRCVGDATAHADALKAARATFGDVEQFQAGAEAQDIYVDRVFRGVDPLADDFRPYDEPEWPTFAELARAVFAPLASHQEGDEL